MATTLTFTAHNATEMNASLFWCDDKGNETWYAMLPPGSSKAQETFGGHKWVLRVQNEGLAVALVAAQRHEDAHMYPSGLGACMQDPVWLSPATQPPRWALLGRQLQGDGGKSKSKTDQKSRPGRVFKSIDLDNLFSRPTVLFIVRD